MFVVCGVLPVVFANVRLSIVDRDDLSTRRRSAGEHCDIKLKTAIEKQFVSSSRATGLVTPCKRLEGNFLSACAGGEYLLDIGIYSK
jgi:hypothetical protein